MVTETRLGLRVETAADFDQAVEAATAALKTEGFGVLTSIDVQATLREKLGASFRRYSILGACNPELANRALTADLDVGLLLPCNVVVYERDGGGSVIEAMAPLTIIGSLAPDGPLGVVAEEADRRLRAALGRVDEAKGR
jgi:uncharacterized protein (DUF302 family)